MEFSYKNHKLERLLSEEKRAQRKFKKEEAKRLFELRDILDRTCRLDEFLRIHGQETRWKPHEIERGGKKCFSFKFSGRLRLVVLRGKGQEDKDWKEVTAIKIVYIGDYHSGKGKQWEP